MKLRGKMTFVLVGVLALALSAGVAMAATISGDDGDNIFTGTPTRDRIDAMGGAENDTITGNEKADPILGESDNDLLAGGLGMDLVRGGEGDDRENGGAGPDPRRHAALCRRRPPEARRAGGGRPWRRVECLPDGNESGLRPG